MDYPLLRLDRAAGLPPDIQPYISAPVTLTFNRCAADPSPTYLTEPCSIGYVAPPHDNQHQLGAWWPRSFTSVPEWDQLLFSNTGQPSPLLFYPPDTTSVALPSRAPDSLVSSTLVYFDFGHIGPTIPQWPYHPPHLVDASITMGSIKFSTASRRGALVKDILDKNFTEFDGRDDPVLGECGTSISLRFEWPGYQSWSRQVKTQDCRKKPNPIRKFKLALEIAKTLERFVQEMQDEQPEDEKQEDEKQAEPQWKVGPGRIQVDHLVLLSLDRVSKASWQPQFCLKAGI